MTKRKVIDEYVSSGTKYLDPVDVIDAFRNARPEDMNDKDLEYYKGLPDIVTIYRGCSLEEFSDDYCVEPYEVADYAKIGDYVIPMGISWTLNPDVARVFASRGRSGCVVEAEVSKEDIKYYISNRKESEAIVFCADATIIEILGDYAKLDYDAYWEGKELVINKAD